MVVTLGDELAVYGQSPPAANRQTLLAAHTPGGGTQTDRKGASQSKTPESTGVALTAHVAPGPFH